MIEAGRAEEAVTFLDRAKPESEFGLVEWHEARISAALAVGDREQGQELRWRMFETTLGPRYLQDYLRELPDFDDVEAGERALTWVEEYQDVHHALGFLFNWPALDHAERVTMNRRSEIDGDAFYVLSPAADALEGKHPLAAVLLRRAMIEDTLNGAKSRRYKHAARHITELEGQKSRITDYTLFESHADFLARIRKTHARKHGFWSRVD